MPSSDNTQLKQLQSAVDAGRELVQQMRQMVTLAIEGLYRLQESSEAKLKQVEEALAQLQVQREEAAAAQQRSGRPPPLRLHWKSRVSSNYSVRLLKLPDP